MPRFLVIDQPTQVYFPSEESYKAVDGTVLNTEQSDADMDSVRKLFSLLYQFTVEDVPGFQIIITEHANLRDDWFQKSLVEAPWSKPPALVPESWPSKVKCRSDELLRALPWRWIVDASTSVASNLGNTGSLNESWPLVPGHHSTRSCHDPPPRRPHSTDTFPHANEAPFAIALWPCSRSAVGKRYRLPNP